MKKTLLTIKNIVTNQWWDGSAWGEEWNQRIYDYDTGGLPKLLPIRTGSTEKAEIVSAGDYDVFYVYFDYNNTESNAPLAEVRSVCEYGSLNWEGPHEQR